MDYILSIPMAHSVMHSGLVQSKIKIRDEYPQIVGGILKFQHVHKLPLSSSPILPKYDS